MSSENKIAELGSRLDDWFDGNTPTFASQDRTAQGESLLRGVAIAREIDSLKRAGMAAIRAQLHGTNSDCKNARVKSLIDTFEFSSRLADTLHDELLDTDAENEIWRMMDSIVLALDEIGRGRAALDVLLNNPLTGVRVAAGAYLIDLDPERVVPILREIDEKGGGNSAYFGAHWTLLAWERQRTSRFNSLNRGVASRVRGD